MTYLNCVLQVRLTSCWVQSIECINVILAIEQGTIVLNADLVRMDVSTVFLPLRLPGFSPGNVLRARPLQQCMGLLSEELSGV